MSYMHIYRSQFRETRTARPVDKDKLAVLTVADDIAAEWVTRERFCRVCPPDAQIENMPEIIRAMLGDIVREGAGEIVWSKEVRRAIGRETVRLFKERPMQGVVA